VAGWVGARWAAAALDKTLGRIAKLDETLRHFFSSLVRYVILAVTALAVLAQFGIQTASLLAVFGAAGLAVGLALQGTLSNVAAGVMLLIFRPFKIGDYVEVAGLAGTVKTVGLFVTELATPDNVHITAPNGQIWGSAVKNFSRNPTRRVDFALDIGYGDDIANAMAAIDAVIAGEDRILADPAPMTAVSNLGDSAVELAVRVWVATDDYWGVTFDLTRAFKERFDADGIDIPYPQRTLHVIKEN
ncbi:MAG: mechanosensitive ion channel family protein, partial [Alphaproteobacteria bacterium]